MSLFPNSPTTNAKLDFNVRVDGNDLSGVCKYEGGVYYDSNGPNSHGCTVSSLLWTLNRFHQLICNVDLHTDRWLCYDCFLLDEQFSAVVMERRI